MTQTPIMPPYERLDQLLDSIDLDVGASEIHGVICGLLCTGHSDAHADWFEDLFANRSPDDLLVREARQLLGQLYQATQLQFSAEDLAFKPFLPGDDLALRQRARGLSEWCQGFLYGLGLAGIGEARLKGDAREAIGDITEFTKLDHETIEAGEETELAYVELEEFLRVATFLIREELSTTQEVTHGSE
ncbi:MAG: UPF0149 family protein [Pseudomonadota bacterium]